MSKIEWTEKTWNPITGCSKVSPGCANCYAEKMANRFKGNKKMPQYRDITHQNGRWNGTINFVPNQLKKPLERKKPTMYFVGSMSDIGHPGVKQDWIDQILFTMSLCPQHTFQILTKRPENLIGRIDRILPNVWIGTSVEDSNRLRRLDELRKIPAAVRFVSFEPLLGPIEYPDLEGIDWAITGCESGPRRRTMNEAWVRRLKDDCIDNGVRFFYKQKMINGKKTSMPILDGRIWDEMPGVTK